MDEMAQPTSRRGSGASDGSDGFFASPRSVGVERRGDDKWVAGVCAALARRLGVDTVLIRGVFVFLILLGGIGVVLYLAAWALLPNSDDEILAEKAIHGDAGGIILLLALAISLFGGSSGKWWLWLVFVPLGCFLWWVVGSARAGKTSEQMGEEASAFANRVAARVGGEHGERSPSRPSAPSQLSQPSQPHGMGPGRTGVAQTEPRVVPSRRPRAGLLGLILTVGLAVAAYGLGSWLATTRDWPGSAALVGIAFALAGAGLGLVVVGALGRRAGFTGFLVTSLAVAAVAATAVPPLPSGGFGDRSWSAASPPAGGFALTAGDAKLDLTGAAPGSTLKVDIGAGQLRILVPPGTTAAVTAEVSAGEVQVTSGGKSTTVDEGANPSSGTPVVVGSGATRVAVDVRLRAGELRIVEVTS